MFADILNRSHNEAQMTVLIGRRRIGKTELALRCGGDGRLLTHYNLIEKHVPVFAKPRTKNVRYILGDNFLTVWFRFFYKYQNFIESGSLVQLGRIIQRDFSVVEGFMLERYFRQRLRESQKYTLIGGYWDRRDENEIDIVAVNEIDGIADIFEVKKQRDRYSESALRSKVDNMLASTPELRGIQLRLGCLSMDDML